MPAPHTDRELIVNTVRKFVAGKSSPWPPAWSIAMNIRTSWSGQMQDMGLFGLNIPEEYGGAGVDTTTFAMVFEEISRGWLGLAGVIGTHSVMCDVLVRFGTEEQKRRFLPGDGHRREARRHLPHRIQRRHRSAEHQHHRRRATAIDYRINGSKMWITNARHGNTFLLLAKTDPAAQPPIAA